MAASRRTTEAPSRPTGRRGRISGRPQRSGLTNTTAPNAAECQSLLHNVVAQTLTFESNTERVQPRRSQSSLNVKEMPTHLSAVATARPIRVAYLIDLASCPKELLDSIFSECYGRWAGRRTLLVPASLDGIDQRYNEWLWYFDPDIIYSFVPLTDDAVAATHERFAPAFIKLHREPRFQEGPPRFLIELPIAGLSSLSVLPVYAARSRGFFRRVSKIEVLDQFWDRSSAPFVQENFGFLRTSLGNAANPARQHPELFTCVTLISREAFENPHNQKDPTRNTSWTRMASLLA